MAIQPINVVTLDPSTTQYSTFGSYHQMMVYTQYGLFAVYLHDTDPPGGDITLDATYYTWRLIQSFDDGQTWRVLYTDTHAHPPVLEADPNGVLYVIIPTYVSGNWDVNSSVFMRFEITNGWTAPVVTKTIANLSGGKTAAFLDWARQCIYYSVWGKWFAILDFNGNIITSYRLTLDGPNAVTEYPLFSMAENGDLYMGITTTPAGSPLGYYDCHLIVSKDGGHTWKKMNGTALVTPFIVDDTGPTDKVSLVAENGHDPWLWSILAKNGKVHLAYRAAMTPAVQHYVRYDIASGLKDMDITPAWSGETISLLSLHGYFLSNPSTGRIYAVAKNSDVTAPDTRIAVLYSDDNGTTWHDYAQSPSLGGPSTVSIVYSQSGPRLSTKNGVLPGFFVNDIGQFNTRSYTAAPYTANPAGRTGADTTWSYNGQSFSVLSGGPFVRNKTIEVVTPHGVTDQVQASAAFRKINDVPIEIVYDDSGGVDGAIQTAYLNDAAYPLVLTYGNGKSSQAQAWVKTYERLPRAGAKTRERVTFAFSGPVVEI